MLVAAPLKHRPHLPHKAINTNYLLMKCLIKVRGPVDKARLIHGFKCKASKHGIFLTPHVLNALQKTLDQLPKKLYSHGGLNPTLFLTNFQQNSGLRPHTSALVSPAALPLTLPPIARPAVTLAFNLGNPYNFKTTTQLLNAAEENSPVSINGHLIHFGSTADVAPIPIHPATRLSIPHTKRTQISVEKRTTTQAIQDATQNGFTPIAINFANEFTRGGNPGYRYDNFTHKFTTYTDKRAGAQEENICEKSDLLRSLRQATYPYRSDQVAYVNPNITFFGTDHTRDISAFVTPTHATVITSAAIDFRHSTHHASIKYDARSLANMQKRIRLHLKAAAYAANESHKKDEKSCLIAGAFGCGAFAPNDPTYPTVIAKIYADLLNGEFANIFDKVVFAIPWFPGDVKGQENYRQFDQVLA